jgi:RNA polymerase sigma-70 factor (ECF subfamily)
MTSQHTRSSRDAEIDALWRQHRPYLVDLAFRLLGRIHDAEDVVQEAFTRLLGADLDEIDEVRGWLVVVVSRLCLDQLRSARTRREDHAGALDRQPVESPARWADPADRVTLDDSVRMALLVVLQQLSPAERAVFVLHDVFQFSFDAVATIVGRSPAACRQVASRARRRIGDATAPARFEAGADEQHEVAQRFIAACAGGDLESLTRLLDPDVAGDVDLGPGGPARSLRGRHRVSAGLLSFLGPRSGVTLVSQPINGKPGVLAFRDRHVEGILVFTVGDGLIRKIHAIADPRKLALVTNQVGADDTDQSQLSRSASSAGEPEIEG